MRENKRPEPRPPRPRADDLQQITGIGPSLARRLGEAGVTSYRDLASLTPERITDLLADAIGISPERIASQDWIGQARRLAGRAPGGARGHQRYATFHLELLIDTDDRIRRTKVRHYQTDTEDSWPGWDGKQLITLIRGRAGPDTGPSRRPEAQRPPASPVHLDELCPAEEGTRGTFRHPGQPTAARMTLRVGPIPGVDTGTVDFTADVAARTVGSRDRHPIAATSGTITIDQPVSLEVAGPPLPPGMHSLEAVVVVHPQNHQPGEQPLCRHRAMGQLVHVAAGQPGSQEGLQPDRRFG